MSSGGLADSDIRAACCLLTFGLLFVSCASAPYAVDHPLAAEYHSSSDNVLQYRIPIGWFDARGEDSPSHAVIWLVRNDYAATISVTEVALDARAASGVRDNDLMRLAELTMLLTATEQNGVVRTSPRAFTLRGREFCAYEVASGEGDTSRVVLLRAGSRWYEMTALVSSAARDSRDVFSVQQSLLNALRW